MNIKLNYPSKVWLNVTPCQEIKLCLGADWAAKTVSGETFVTAKIDHHTRALGSFGKTNLPGAFNVRGADITQYSLLIDDAQILDETPGVKFKLTCKDINGVITETCPE